MNQVRVLCFYTYRHIRINILVFPLLREEDEQIDNDPIELGLVYLQVSTTDRSSLGSAVDDVRYYTYLFASGRSKREIHRSAFNTRSIIVTRLSIHMTRMPVEGYQSRRPVDR